MMNLHYLTLLFCIIASGADAFSVRPSLTSPNSLRYASGRYLRQDRHTWQNLDKATKSTTATTRLNDGLDPNNNSPKFSLPTEKTAAEIVARIKENVTSGEVGTRGEAYFAAQAILVVSILYGEIPLIGDLVSFLAGPCLVFLGLILIALGIKDLGSNISPWPQAPENASLVTDGIYGEIRHPVYAGLIFFCFGISMWTGSATRVVLCLLLCLLLDKKTTFEEEALIDKFQGDYLDYMVDVGGKFLPAALEEAMPWTEDP